MHNANKVVTLPEKKKHLVLLLKYLLTFDHFVIVCIKGLNISNFLVYLFERKCDKFSLYLITCVLIYLLVFIDNLESYDGCHGLRFVFGCCFFPKGTVSLVFF